MTAIVYRNTKTTLPGVPLVNLPRGIAYDAGSHFVHFYGAGSDLLYAISARITGVSMTEKKRGTLNDWATRVFGATDIKDAVHPVGSTVQGVWRPGLRLQNETLQGLGNSASDQRSSEQALRLLVEGLDELLLYIEPDPHGLNAYSHKTRELLILACTEVENTWQYYMRIAGATPPSKAGFNTTDYVKLLVPLYLSEFEIVLKPYSSVAPLRPFAEWDAKAPTTSLTWYDSYNKTKHDRTSHFDKATLQNCLSSIAANIVLFSVRFSPFPIHEGTGTLAALINQLFSIQLPGFKPESCYVPMVQLPDPIEDNLLSRNVFELVKPWTMRPLKL